MLKQKELLHRAWDLFISLCATASALMLPFGLVFGLEGPHLVYVDLIFTGFYIADIIVRYRRVERGRGYGIHTWLFDVISALPFYLIFGLSPIQLLRLLKLYRLVGFMRQWRRRQARNANVLRLVFFCYWLLLSAHGITCGWVALREAPALADQWDRYLDGLYWCVTTLTTVGYGDVTPANNAQQLYAIGVMILGVGVYAFVIGNIATLLTNIDPARTQYLQQRERLAAFMQYRNLPRPLQRRISDYYDYLWEKRLLYDETSILKDLPPSLSTDVSLFLKRDLIGNVPLFQEASDAFIREIALQLEAVIFLPGDVIIRAGEQGRDMYFISRGVVEILSPDGTVLNTLSNGDFFGEIALFTNQPRSASVRAVEYGDFYRLDKTLFERVLSHYPDIAEAMKVKARSRHDGDEHLWTGGREEKDGGG